MSARSRDRQAVHLHLLRHADAGDPEAWRGPDEARPLSDKGRAQGERLGAFLASVGFRPDAIVSSPKVRAAQTAEIVAGALGTSVSIDERLAGGFGPESLGELLRNLGVRRPVLVGHDPDFSELLTDLVGGSRLEMKKGALCRIDLELPPSTGDGVLRWLVPPDLLDPS
ncbi:MAG: phosphohistidine phosphatase [Chloroflexota bacterium]|jgi:phosphohistidine phosphatase|nr:phosphohistidine phosphatase [Chloroflexota bacterium]